eukprot:5069607-Pyramimonas_sp.AAC.1
MGKQGERAISTANVKAKRGKLGREVAAAVELTEKAQFQKDLACVQEEVAKDLEKMKSVKQVVELDTDGYDPSA